MLRYRDIYSTNFRDFQRLCRDDLQNKIHEDKTGSILSDLNINMKVNGDIFKVKYSSLCKFNLLFQVASRGTTWFSDGKWFFTMPKFPNGVESLSFWGVEEKVVIDDLISQGYKIEFMPKWDGSAIHIFRKDGHTFAYTLGSLNEEIKMQGSIQESPTFFGLAIDLFRSQYPNGEEWLDAHPGYGLMFEMCSRWNLIVTQYTDLGENGRLHPLVVVDANGELSWDWPAEMLKDHVSWNTPEGLKAEQMSDLQDEIMKRLVSESKFGINPEGVVIYAVKRDASGVATEVHPIFKKKRPEYLFNHRTIALNPGTKNDLNSVCEAVLQDTYDDWIHPNEMYKKIRDEYRDRLEEYLITICHRLKGVLTILDDTEYQGAKNRGKFAKYVQSIGLPEWLLNGFYFMHKQGKRFSENSELELIKNILLGVYKQPADGVVGITRLATLQRVSPYWFNPKLETTVKRSEKDYSDYVQTPILPWAGLPLLVVFDWDRTFAPSPNGLHPNRYENEDTLRSPYPKAVELCKIYRLLGWRVVFVTGRIYRLSEAIGNLLRSVGINDYELFCCPPLNGVKMPTVDFKQETVLSLARDTLADDPEGKLVHFDDDRRVLARLSGTVGKEFNYYPYSSVEGGDIPIYKPYLPKERPIVVVKIGPPGSGKTSLSRSLAKICVDHGLKFVSTGFDKVVLEGGHLSSEELYEKVMSEIRVNLQPKSLIFIDMCHDNNNILKRMRQLHTSHEIHLFTFTSMLIDEVKVKNKSGKTTVRQQANEEYLKMLIERAHHRIDDADDSSSTLVSHDKVEKAIRQKAEGCVNTVKNPNFEVHLLDFKESPDGWAKTIFERISKLKTKTNLADYAVLPSIV